MLINFTKDEIRVLATILGSMSDREDQKAYHKSRVFYKGDYDSDIAYNAYDKLDEAAVKLFRRGIK